MWLLYCPSFDLRHMITPLLSSSFTMRFIYNAHFTISNLIILFFLSSFIILFLLASFVMKYIFHISTNILKNAMKWHSYAIMEGFWQGAFILGGLLSHCFFVRQFLSWCTRIVWLFHLEREDFSSGTFCPGGFGLRYGFVMLTVIVYTRKTNKNRNVLLWKHVLNVCENSEILCVLSLIKWKLSCCCKW